MIRIELSVRNILTIAGVLAGVWLLTKVWSVLLLAGVGLLIAAALMPYVDWLWRRTHNRALAVVIVISCVLLAIAAVLLIIAPPVITQTRNLWEQAPELQSRAASFAEERGWYDVRDRILAFQPESVLDERLVDTSRAALGVVFSIITVVFLAAYFLLDARRLKQFMYFCTPRPWRRHIRELLPALQRVVGGYIRGQAITSASIFAFSFIMLTVLDVPDPLALSAIAAIADLIPLVGVYILITPMTLVAFSVSTTTGLLVAGAMVLYQQFEDRLLIPRVYGATLRLPTIAVVLALLTGAQLLGLVGALIALPVAAAIRVIVEYFARVRADSARAAAEEAAPEDEAFAPDDGQAAARLVGFTGS
jgi:putative heme transporter